MKKIVDLSTWCKVMTALGLIILLVALYCSINVISTIIVGVALFLLCCSALFYMPVSISVDETSLAIRLPLRIKRIPLNEISSIELLQPTMAERRICGSGGWFGYWGWFKEKSIGKYFAYYGKASECFLVTLNNGRRYMLSCRQPNQLVDLVNSKLRAR